MTNRPITRATVTSVAALTMLLTFAATAEPLAPTGGAGNTGVTAPPGTGRVGSGARELGPAPAPAGNAAGPSNEPVPGTTPGVNIGGTGTAGPPGTGGAAGGPGLTGQ